MKLKNYTSVDVLILGVRKTKDYPAIAQSLLIGVKKGQEIVRLGTVSSWEGSDGLNIKRQIAVLSHKDSPLRDHEDKEFVYFTNVAIESKLMPIEVKYLRVLHSDDGYTLREPRVIRVRSDKPNNKCLWEQLKNQNILEVDKRSINKEFADNLSDKLGQI